MASSDHGLAREPDLLPPLDGGPGPAVRISERHVDQLIDSVMERIELRPRRRGLRRLPRWLLVAAVFGVAGAAAATAVVATRAPEPQLPAASSTPPVASAPSPERATRAPEPSAAASAEAEPDSQQAPAPDLPGKTEGPEARTQAARDLLQSANALRGQGRWRAAEQAYSRVMSRFAGTSQAYVATLAAASLRLEHLRDPAGALRLYQAVLRGGSLGEEAQFGVARCHRAMGNTSAEAAALRRLVATRPGSLLREQAERRLRQIEGGR